MSSTVSCRTPSFISPSITRSSHFCSRGGNARTMVVNSPSFSRRSPLAARRSNHCTQVSPHRGRVGEVKGAQPSSHCAPRSRPRPSRWTASPRSRHWAACARCRMRSDHALSARSRPGRVKGGGEVGGGRWCGRALSTWCGCPPAPRLRGNRPSRWCRAHAARPNGNGKPGRRCAWGPAPRGGRIVVKRRTTDDDTARRTLKFLMRWAWGPCRGRSYARTYASAMLASFIWYRGRSCVSRCGSTSLMMGNKLCPALTRSRMAAGNSNRNRRSFFDRAFASRATVMAANLSNMLHSWLRMSAGMHVAVCKHSGRVASSPPWQPFGPGL